MNLQARRAGAPCCPLDDRVDVLRLERRPVTLRSRNRGFAAHRGVARRLHPMLLVPNQRLRRALRCLQLHDFARSGKPVGALADIVLESSMLSASMLSNRRVRPGYAREQKSSVSGGWHDGSWYWAVLVLLVATMVAATAVGISLRIL